MRRFLATHISLLVLVGVAAPAHAEQPKRKVSMLPAGTPPARVPAIPTVNPHQAARTLAQQAPVSHLQRGLYLKGKGESSQALIEFILAAQENPRQVRAFYEQAQLFKQMGNDRMARSALEQALAIAPAYANARTMLISLHMQSGDLGGAARETGLLLSEQTKASQRQFEEKMQNIPDERGLPAIQVTHGLLPEPVEQPVTKPSPKPASNTESKSDFAEVAARLGISNGEQAGHAGAEATQHAHAPTLPLSPSDAKHIPNGRADGLPSMMNAQSPGNEKRSLWRNMTSYTVAGFRQPMKQMSGLWPLKNRQSETAPPPPTTHLAANPATQRLQQQAPSVKAETPATIANMPDTLKDVLSKVPDVEPRIHTPNTEYSFMKDTAASRISEFANAASSAGADTSIKENAKRWFEFPKMPKLIPHVELPLLGKKDQEQPKSPARTAQVADPTPMPSAVIQPKKEEEEPLWKQAFGFLPKLMPDPKPVTAPAAMPPAPVKSVVVMPENKNTDNGLFKSLTSWIPDFGMKPKPPLPALPKADEHKLAVKPTEKPTHTPDLIPLKPGEDTPVSSDKMPSAMAHDAASPTPESIKKILAGLGLKDNPETVRVVAPAPAPPSSLTQNTATTDASAPPLDIQRILGKFSRRKKGRGEPKPLIVEQSTPSLPDAVKTDKVSIDPLAPTAVLNHNPHSPTPPSAIPAKPAHLEGENHLPTIVHQILESAKSGADLPVHTPSPAISQAAPQPVPLAELLSGKSETRGPAPIINSDTGKESSAPAPIPASVERHLDNLMVPVPSAGLPTPSPVPRGIQQILNKVAPLKNNIEVPQTGHHAPTPTTLHTQNGAAPMPTSPARATATHGHPGFVPQGLHPTQTATPMPQPSDNRLADSLPPIVRDIVQNASSPLPQITVPLAIAEAIMPQPVHIPKNEMGQGPAPMQLSDNSGTSQAPAPIPAQLDKYLQNLMVPVMKQPAAEPPQQNAQGAKERSKAMVATNTQHSGAFNYNMPTLQTDKAFLMGNQTRHIPQAPVAPVKKVAPPPEDAITKRMRYLMEHGTGTLKPGEAFMYSEETGEGILFLPTGDKEKRKLAAPQDHDEVLRARRPDIIDPRDMQYSLNLLGKLLGNESQQQQQQNQQQNQKAPYNAPSLDQLMTQTQKGFWGWFKDTMKMP